ncbi:MAG: PqqD family protein [Opitutae bacterium]|nr:PqqD family protein [Opitutae bacterium]
MTDSSCPRSPDPCHLRFRLRDDTAIEDFGDRSLVLLCDSLHLREVNGRSKQLLELLDGERTVQDIAWAVAAGCGVPAREMLAPIAEALREMERHGIVRRVVDLKMERPEPMNAAKFLVNPDVSFRQEDDDGGILFNPDTDSIEVINPVAVAIWTFLAAPRTQAEVVAHLCEVCEGTARAQVEKDVDEFIGSLLKKGFIGVVETSA